MLEYMIVTDIAKIEMEQLDKKIARLRRAGLLGGEEKNQPLAGLAAVGSHALMSLGSALVSVGKRLSSRTTSGRAATV